MELFVRHGVCLLYSYFCAVLFERCRLSRKNVKNMEKERLAFANGAEMIMAKEKMLGNTKNGKRALPRQKKKNSNVAAGRMGIMILADIAAICILNALGTSGALELAFYENWLLPLTVIFGVLTLGAAIYQAVVIVKKIDTSGHYVTPAMILCVVLFGLLSCLLYTRLIPATIMIASVVGTVLFVVYCLYMHVFYR